MATTGSPRPSQSFLASGQGSGAERPHGLTPPPPSAPGLGTERANRWAGRGAAPGHTPPCRLFLGLRRATGRWLLPLASWGALSSSPTPARLQPGSSPAPALLRLCSSPAPAWLPFSAATPLRELRTSTPSSQLSVPLSLSVPHPRDLAPSQDPVPDLLPPSTPPQSSALSLAPHLPGRQSVCLSASPPSFSFLCPASLVCSLVRLGGAASQENPRNHCKKLTMKFKKFYDFGAIFEWSER